MAELEIHMDGDGCWPDLELGSNDVQTGELTSIARLTGGMKSGKSSVALRIETPSGVLIAETSMFLFLSAAQAFAAREEAEEPR